MDSWERLQSEFSGDVNYLNRLNVLLYLADEAALDLDAHTWFHTLIVLMRELSTEFKKGEEEEGEVFINAISPLINNNSKDLQRKGKIGINPNLYMKLHKFEMYIRRILKESGLQNKMKDDASGALR